MRTDNSAQPLIGFPLLLLLICTTAMSGCDRRLPNPGEPMIAPQAQTPATEVGDRSQQFLADFPRSSSLWIAGGIGVTPFIAKLRAGDLMAPTELIYTYRHRDAAAYLSELQEHADHQPLFALRTLVAQEDPRPVFALFDDVQHLQSREVYISGPPLFVHAIAEELHNRGVSRSNMHFEESEFRSNHS